MSLDPNGDVLWMPVVLRRPQAASELKGLAYRVEPASGGSPILSGTANFDTQGQWAESLPLREGVWRISFTSAAGWYAQFQATLEVKGILGAVYPTLQPPKGD